MEKEFEITEQPKPIPSKMNNFTPALEAAAIIKRKVLQKEQFEKLLSEKKEKENKFLGQLATYVFFMEKALERFEEIFIKNNLKNEFREFRVLKNQMRRSLEEYGISIKDPLGQIFDEKMEEDVEVIGWVSEEGEKRVKQTHEPIIMRDNQIIKPGQVTVSSPSISKTN